MGSSLEDLVAEGVVGEVLARLKSGKEADVFVVRYGSRVCAAKAYKDRAHRSFKNNADYLEGRQVRNTRSQRAMGRKSRFGQAAAEDAWKASEADALYKLHAAGVRVPTPVMFLDGVLLMELVLGEDGAAAPRLVDVQLTAEQANEAYHDMLRQLVRILSCDLIHGDLSPYNVLWAPAGPTIIDFPQTISAAHNSQAERFFLRDANNILGHFASIDRSLHARSSDPAEIWRAYRTRELTPDFVPTGRRSFARPAIAGPGGARREDPRPRPEGGRPAHASPGGARREDPRPRPEGGHPGHHGSGGARREEPRPRPEGGRPAHHHGAGAPRRPDEARPRGHEPARAGRGPATRAVPAPEVIIRRTPPRASAPDEVRPGDAPPPPGDPPRRRRRIPG